MTGHEVVTEVTETATEVTVIESVLNGLAAVSVRVDCTPGVRLVTLPERVKFVAEVRISPGANDLVPGVSAPTSKSKAATAMIHLERAPENALCSIR